MIPLVYTIAFIKRISCSIYNTRNRVGFPQTCWISYPIHLLLKKLINIHLPFGFLHNALFCFRFSKYCFLALWYTLSPGFNFFSKAALRWGSFKILKAYAVASFILSLPSSCHLLGFTLLRGNKYREAGADCIFVQPVWEKETISTLVKEINGPINILSNPGIGGGLPPSVQELQDLGVARLSLGSGLMKATLALMKKVADELSQKGTYTILSDELTPLSDAAMAYKMATRLNK